MDLFESLDQFRDCAGRPEKEGFLVSKDQVSFLVGSPRSPGPGRTGSQSPRSYGYFKKILYKECCPNESDFYEFLSKQKTSLQEFITGYHGLETFDLNGELSYGFNTTI